MRRMFKGLWYMICDIVGILLTTLIMMPIYALDIAGNTLVMSANEIMWDIYKRSIIGVILDIVFTAVAVIIDIVMPVVTWPILVIVSVIDAAMSASKYAGCRDEKYHYSWRYLWNILQYGNIKAKHNNENKERSGFNFKSYSDK